MLSGKIDEFSQLFFKLITRLALKRLKEQEPSIDLLKYAWMGDRFGWKLKKHRKNGCSLGFWLNSRKLVSNSWN